MGYTVCERLVKDSADMTEVEKCIVRHTGGENHRCAFFRSVPYIRLRIAALYLPFLPNLNSPNSGLTPHVAYCGDLSVMMTPTEAGPVVSVHCSYEPTYPDDFQAEIAPTCRKRMRVE
jgi:hypothetical protein